MHFTWEFSIGQLIVGFPIMGILIFLFKIYNMLLNFRIEHEILMQDWAIRDNKKLHELPTRMKKWW